jgi:ribosomal protein S18 acetylase RimI-like enzyme
LADPSDDLIRGYLETGQIWIALDREDICGVYVMREASPGTVELVSIAVHPTRQRQGIGMLLLGHALKEARRQGYHTMTVGTGNSSIGPLILYQRCGFRIVEVVADFFVREYPDPLYEEGIPCRDKVILSRPL